MLFLLSETAAQDSLLLTNGRVRKLKGSVVYYDHDDILYQNERQARRMKTYVAQKKRADEVYRASDEWRIRQENQEERALNQRQKAKAKLETRRKDFEEDVKEKMNRLSPGDFEKWKNRELARLMALEKKRKLKHALLGQLKEAEVRKEEARERAMFTRRIPRDVVFSILKPDSTEVVVYNADTLGFFADGESELDYGVAEMRLYIKGRQDGRRHRTAFDAVLGVAVGALSSSFGAYWGPSIPAGTLVVTSIANIRIKKMANKDPFLLVHPAYKDGYDRSAKRKKAWDFVKGSVAGLGFGMLVWDGIVRGEGLPGPR